MDRMIKKVKKDVERGEKSQAKKDIFKLMKMDKKIDAKVKKCEGMEKHEKMEHKKK